MTRQKATKADVGSLSDAQIVALTALLAGQTTEQAAQAAGVTRQTVSFWRNRDTTFMVAYHEARAELLESGMDTLRLAVLEALAVLRDDLNSEQPADRARAAALILRTWAALREETGKTGETSEVMLSFGRL